MEIKEWIVPILTIIGFIPLYLDYFQRREERKIKPLIKKFKESINQTGYIEWRLNITNPTNKPIERCSVLCNTKQLPWSNKEEPYSEIIIPSGGAANVLIPEEPPVDAFIIVKNGKETLSKIKYKDILK